MRLIPTDPPLLPSQTEPSSNRRFVVQLDDGAEVETVLYRGDTLCLSSQVGCAVACPFCASGAFGLDRPLTLEELQFQVTAVIRAGYPVKRLTLSGVGEPLHNHVATMALLHWARSQGYAVSLTTTGGPLRRLRQWLQAPHRGLNISVHAGRETTRKAMVPHGPQLGSLFSCLHTELPRLSNTRRKKTALAYLLVAGLNDEDADLDAFADRVLALSAPLTVHLYDLNPVPTSPHRGVARARYEQVYTRLSAQGLNVRMSSKARLEANGGCGTLVALRRKPTIS